MDLFAITKVSTDIANSVSQKLQPPTVSHFVGAESMMPMMPMGGPQQQPKQGIKVSDVLSLILGVVIGLYAAYLSWQCNAKLSYNTFLKVIFAIFAYMFGLIYLILYVVMRWDTCRRL